MNSLQRLVRAYDRLRNTDYQMQVTERAPTTKLICFDCRRVPDVAALQKVWYDAHKDAWAYLVTPWPGLNGICPSCKGRLVEVTV